MLRSRSCWLARVACVLLGLTVVLSASSQAEAATRTRHRVAHVAKTSRHYSATRASLRRARLARAKAAVYARDMRALETPHFKMDANGQQVPDIRAEAAIIYNPVTRQVVWEENSTETRSIASITKVMTAVVFMEHATDLSTEVDVLPTDVLHASTTYLRAHDKITPESLLHLMLIGSDNAAARVLARVSPFGSAGFIDQMNAKAKELHLDNTHYADPCGLDPNNVSSAFDMARLISFASNDERISSVMRKSEDTVMTNRRTITVHSTNKLLAGGEVPVRGGKTGFIRQAGYCLATLLQMPQGDPMAVVVLGARSNAGRFMETKHLFEWISDRTNSLLKPATTAAPKPSDAALPLLPAIPIPQGQQH